METIVVELQIQLFGLRFDLFYLSSLCRFPCEEVCYCDNVSFPFWVKQ